MKKINLISALSYKHQYELYYWFWITLIAWCSIIMVTTWFLVPLLFHYKALKKETHTLQAKTKQYNTLMNEKSVIKKEYEKTQAQENKVNKYNSEFQHYHVHLETVNRVLSSSFVQLQSLECNKKEYILHVISDSTKDIQVFIEQLMHSDTFKKVILYSLEKKHANQWFCIIKIQL